MEESEQSFNEEEDGFKRFIKLLSSFYLNALELLFKQTIAKKSSSDRGLTKSEFVDAINEVFGETNYTAEAIALYEEIDKTETRSITWLQFLDYLTCESSVKPYPKLEFGGHKITAVPHVMRDTIVKIVQIESEKYFCYAIVSKYGRVGLYDGNMNFLISYHVIMAKEDVVRTDVERRRRNRWITDVLYLPDLFILMVMNSTRSITIYDASGLKHVAIWLIIGYPNIICATSYYFQESTNSCVVYAGDETGTVTSFSFLQSKMGLLRRKHNDKLSVFYWTEMPMEKDFVIVKNLYKGHDEAIRRIQFLADEKMLVTCSRDAKNSVVIKSLIQKREPYVFKMRRGSNCFVLTKSLLITGSDDGAIRLWNPVITSKPLAILKQHASGIVDLAIVEFLQFFISCSRDGVLKLWDIKSESCLQTEVFKFPSFKVHGKTIEWGINAIYPGPKRQTSDGNREKTVWQRSHIIISCCNHIATVKMVFLDESDRENFDLPVLVPPPLQNSVLIPNNWRNDVKDNAEEPIALNLDDIEIDEEVIEERLHALKFILDKNVVEEFGLKSDINQKIARLETKKSEMLLNVERCAPFLALDLHDCEEIRLDETLPIPNRRRTRSLVEHTRRMLSAASTRSQIFSEPTSSSRLSSRSSIMEFD